MIPLNELFVFLGAAFCLAIVPGPDNIFVLTQSALSGPRAGIITTLGLCTGLIFHTTAVALGVASIIMTSDNAFIILKSIGASYLLYLAYSAFRAKGVNVSNTQKSSSTSKQFYLRGVIMNITNPKVSIFFLAFLPQFVDPNRGNMVLQIVTLGLLFIFSSFVVFGVFALLAGKIGKTLQNSSSISNILNKLTGFVFASLAVKLALAKK